MGDKYSKILIVEVNWLGDVLFSTPLIKAVRKKFKNAHIACMVVPEQKDALSGNPNVDEIIIYDEKGRHKGALGKMRLTANLRKKHFDLAVLLHRSFTRTLMMCMAGIPSRVGYITKKRQRFLTHPVEAADTELHKVEYFLRIAESMGCDISDKDYEIFIEESHIKRVEEILAKSRIKTSDFLVVINPGGNWAPKRWSWENYAKLIDSITEKYQLKIIISGAAKDEKLADRIRSKVKEKESVVSLAGKTDLKELAALMKRANIVISGDSGPMHIAVSVKSNVLALFGPTSPELTGPYGSGHYVVIQNDIGCETPCYELTCNDYKCMESIKVEDVLGTFDKMYNKCRK